MQQAGPISKHNLKLINFAAAEGSLGIDLCKQAKRLSPETQRGNTKSSRLSLITMAGMPKPFVE